MDSEQRRGLLRSAILGPLTLSQWASKAGVDACILSPGYPHPHSPATLHNLAVAAAHLLGVDPDVLEVWLTGDAEIPDLVSFLKETSRKRECGTCRVWVALPEFDINQGCCRACHRQRMRTGKGAKYFELMAKALPQIRAVRPALADAVADAVADPSRALTNERLAKAAGMNAREVGALLKRLGLDKRSIAGVLLGLGLAIGGSANAEHPVSVHKSACVTDRGGRRRCVRRRLRGGSSHGSARPIAPIATAPAALGAAS